MPVGSNVSAVAAVAAVDFIKPIQIRLMKMFVYVSMVRSVFVVAFALLPL